MLSGRQERTGRIASCDGMSSDLKAEKALIFRIVHRENIPWILDNGLHCRNSHVTDPQYVNIGNPELIDKRSHRMVPCPPGGTLSDYVPFYFTPFSPMLLNIKTGYGGIQRRSNSEIVIVVSSLHRLTAQNVRWIFADRHAYLQTAQFYDSAVNLDVMDWPMLQQRDFKRDPDHPERFERYHAEALAYQHVPISALLGIVSYDQATSARLQRCLAQRQLTLQLVTRPKWYF